MINPIAGQSFIDLAIQEQRNPLYAVQLAFENGLSITDDLAYDLPLTAPAYQVNESFELTPIVKKQIAFDSEVICMNNQSVIDIAIQESGNPFSAMEWLFKNGVNITDLLEPGKKLLNPTSLFIKSDIVNYFKNRGMKVATYYTPEEEQIITDILDYALPGEFPYSF